MGYITVKNKQGTSGKASPPGYSSWLDFWERKMGKKSDFCGANFCLRKDLIGGHVIRVVEGGKEYILPICSKHNHPEAGEYLAWEADLVLVKS